MSLPVIAHSANTIKRVSKSFTVKRVNFDETTDQGIENLQRFRERYNAELDDYTKDHLDELQKQYPDEEADCIQAFIQNDFVDWLQKDMYEKGEFLV